MRIINSRDIMETIEMLTAENLDVRTVTMGISLLDCIDPDADKACEKIYNKITRLAGNLVSVVDGISAEYGIPIVNKRISVTPIAMLLGAAPDADPVQYAKTLDRAAKAVGVNFIGGFGALVHKGFSAGDKRLIAAIPRALAETDIVCSSVNIGSTKSGINMDAVKLMGEVVRETAELTKDNMCMGDAKLVVFCNAPEDNPFMAGAFHGIGEPETVINVGVSGPGVVQSAIRRAGDCSIGEVADVIKKTAFKITRVGQPVQRGAGLWRFAGIRQRVRACADRQDLQGTASEAPDGDGGPPAAPQRFEHPADHHPGGLREHQLLLPPVPRALRPLMPVPI